MKTIILTSVLLTSIFGFSNDIDSIEVYKSKRDMHLYKNGMIFKSFKIALGKKKLPKEKEGDRKTPEGKYIINDKNSSSKFYKNLGINYPNDNDLTLKRTGSNIKIHGIRPFWSFLGKLHRTFNWTNGCIAVTNKEMGFIYQNVSIGTKIIIKP